jgi:hypothetical protein
MSSVQQNVPHGISIDDLMKGYTQINKDQFNAKMLIIPHGMGGLNIGILRKYNNVMIATGIDHDYVNNDESFQNFIRQTNAFTPDVIVAGSRGTELVARVLSSESEILKNCKILLFGAVYLQDLLCKNNFNNQIIIVHGKHDVNERIEMVRSAVETCHCKQHCTLIETNNSHDMSMDECIMDRVVRYVM